MPRRVMFDGKVQEFPDDATDDEISAALGGGGTEKKSWSLPGFISNAGSSAANFAGNIAKAVTSPRQTLSTLSDVAQGGMVRGAQALGVKDGWTPEAEGRGQKFDAVIGSYKERYGSPAKAAQTLYEDPVGVASDVSMVAGGAGLMAGAARLPRVANAAHAVSKATNPLSAVKALPKPNIDALSKRMYQSALKPSSKDGLGSIDEMTNAGLEAGIPVSRGGLDKTRAAIDTIDNQVESTIKAGAERGLTVDPTKVAGYTDRSIGKFIYQADNAADLAAVKGVRDRFLEQNSVKAPYTKIAPIVNEGSGFMPVGKGNTVMPRPIPVDSAHAMKRGTYRKLRDDYGELGSAPKEALKDLARGLKEGVYEHFPELRHLGQQEKVLIDLEQALERFAIRHGNKDLVGIGTPIFGTAAGVASGSGAGAALGAILKSAIDNPSIKSHLAIALKRASKAPPPPAGTARAVNAVSNLASQQ